MHIGLGRVEIGIAWIKGQRLGRADSRLFASLQIGQNLGTSRVVITGLWRTRDRLIDDLQRFRVPPSPIRTQIASR